MEIKISNKKIGDNNPVFIVAELGVNHNGKLNLAKKIIVAAKRAGADAVKLQSFVTEDFIGDKKLKYTYKSQGKIVTESQYKMFKRNELDKKTQEALFAFAKKIGIIVFSTPQDHSFETVDYLCDKLKMPMIKIGSDDLTSLPMLAYYAKKKKPIIISTGMAELIEVKDAVSAIKKAGNKNIIILKCTSLYPTPPEEANLSQIKTLRREFKDCLIGFSDHTVGPVASVAAVALGAVLIEKHFTLDHSLAGPDHWFSSNPKEFADLVKQIRETEKVLGRLDFKLSRAEQTVKKISRRSVMAVKAIKKGQPITKDMLAVKRPGTGLPPKYLAVIIRKTAKKSYNQGYIFTKKDL